MRIARQTLKSWFVLRLSMLTFFISMTAIGYGLLSENGNSALFGLLLIYILTLNDDIVSLISTFSDL